MEPVTRRIRNLPERLDEDDRSRGGSIRYEDARVSKIFEWLLGIAAVLIAAAILGIWNSQSSIRDAQAELKTGQAVMTVQLAPMQSQIRDLSTEVQELRGEVKQMKAQIGDVQSKQQQAINR